MNLLTYGFGEVLGSKASFLNIEIGAFQKLEAAIWESS